MERLRVPFEEKVGLQLPQGRFLRTVYRSPPIAPYGFTFIQAFVSLVWLADDGAPASILIRGQLVASGGPGSPLAFGDAVGLGQFPPTPGAQVVFPAIVTGIGALADDVHFELGLYSPQTARAIEFRVTGELVAGIHVVG